MWCWSPHPRVSGVGIRVYHPCPHPSRPPPPPRTEAWACWPHTKWCEEFSPRSFDLGVVHDSLLIVGQHATHAPRLPLARNARRNAARFESRAIAHLWRPKAPSGESERQLARDQLARDYERVPAAGAGYGSEREARQGAVRSRWVARAAQSLRCSMRIHQESVQVCAYRLLITARGVCVCVRGCGVWVCGCGVWGAGATKGLI